MVGLLTWPAHGTWFAGSGRGWIDRGCAAPLTRLPEPDRRGRDGLKWPAVRLDAAQRGVIIEDLKRIAALRDFDLLVVAAAEDHVHALLRLGAGRDVPRLVQLIKGALARALSVAAEDHGAVSTGGAALPHHKWWSRQYSFRVVPDGDALARIIERLETHGGATLWRAPDAPERAGFDR